MLLQEIDRFHGRTGGIDQVAYFADALGMEGAFSPNVVQGNGQYGTAILSRFEILDSGRFPLPNAAGGEPRGLQWAGLEVGGQEVRVYNTHLQNKLVGLREAQARHVAGILAGEEQPTILGGDMNATANTPTLGPLLAQLVDAWPVAGSGPEGTGPNGSRIDFVMASPTLEPQQRPGAALGRLGPRADRRRLRGAGLDRLPDAPAPGLSAPASGRPAPGGSRGTGSAAGPRRAGGCSGAARARACPRTSTSRRTTRTGRGRR